MSRTCLQVAADVPNLEAMNRSRSTMARAQVANGAAKGREGSPLFPLLPSAPSTLAGCGSAKSRSYEWVKKYDGKSLYCQGGQRSVGKELSLSSSTL